MDTNMEFHGKKPWNSMVYAMEFHGQKDGIPWSKKWNSILNKNCCRSRQCVYYTLVNSAESIQHIQLHEGIGAKGRTLTTETG